MIYLDYAAHTSIDKKVFDRMTNISYAFPGSVNSDYSIGKKATEKYNELCDSILRYMNLENYELILTSGATESNNLAIKGVADIYKSFGNHIISTPFEHSSTKGSLMTLKSQGFNIDFIEIDDRGYINIDSLKSLLNSNTILVTICSVNSETGHIQNIEKISNMVKSFNNNIIFHIDDTQGFGKINTNYSYCDLITASSHKLYGPTSGGGVLIKNKNILLKPQIDGGKSSTPFRSATPDLVMLAAMHECTKIAFENKEENFKYVSTLRNKLLDYFKTKDFFINSDLDNPYILNISTSINGERLKDLLSDHEIYISTKSSCEAKNSIPNSVNIIYKNIKRAKNSIRISLSHKTTIEEVDSFINIFEKIYGDLNG